MEICTFRCPSLDNEIEVSSFFDRDYRALQLFRWPAALLKAWSADIDACVDWLATRGSSLGSAAVVYPGLMIIIQSSKQVGQE